MTPKPLIPLTILILLLTASCAPPPPPNGPRPEQPATQPTRPEQNRSASIDTQPAVEPTNTSSNTSVNTTGCPAADFLTLQSHPQNSAYPTPELNVTCTNGQVIVHSNGIPNFEFVPTTPNQLTPQNFTFTFPQNPVKAAAPTDIPLGGPAAVAVNGLPIFGPTEAPQDGYRDPYLDQILDYCNGHTAPGGVYHFHARPDCLYENSAGQTGLVLAYSFDGYPILAPYICEDAACTTVTKVESGWELTNPDVTNAWEQHTYTPGRSPLDQCNGLTLADGSYAYFATDTFPYFMGCYHGQPTRNNVGR